MINKIVRKSMTKKKGLLAAIVVLLVISSLFVGISHFVYDTMANNYEQIQIDSNVEDFRLYTLPVADDQFNEIYTKEFISSFENKFKVNIELEEIANYKTDNSDDRRYSLIKYNEDDEINKIVLEDGKLPLKKNEILLQPQALEAIGLSIGDELKIGKTSYKISGTGYLVEFLLPADIANNMIYPNFDKFVPVVINGSSFDQLDRDSDNYTFNEVYKGKFFDYKDRIKKRNSIYEKMIEYKQLEMPVLDDNGNPQISSTGKLVTKSVNRFLFSMDRTTNPTISSVENEIQGSQTTFIFLASLLSIITIFLAVILVNSVFKSQRREIGIMKAEGVSIPKLGFGFTVYMAITMLCGSLIGIFISIFGSQAFRNYYAKTFMLKDYNVTNDVMLVVLTDLAKIGIVMLIAIYFISIRKNLNTPTLHLVKNINSEKAPKYNVGKYFKHLSFVRKYQLNLVLRNFSKTILLAFAVIVSSFLILLGTLMYTSVHDMMDNMYGENFKFSYVTLYSEDNIKNEDEVENGMVSKSTKLISVPRQNELEEALTGEETVNFEAYNFDESTTVNLTDQNGDKLTNDIDGAIASSGFMKQYNLQIGDTFVVDNPYKADEQQIEIKIAAETSDYFLPYVYMPLDLYQSTFGIRDNMINGFQSTEKLTTADKKQILKDDPGAFVYEAADMEEMMGDSLAILNVAIIIIGVLAAIIAFVALYSISTVIIESNSKTISVMKVLGYSSREVSLITIGIYKWMVIVIYLASIPLLEWSIQSAVNQAMADMDFTIPINLNYLYSSLGLIVILVVYMIASRLTYRKIENIKLAESLKADE